MFEKLKEYWLYIVLWLIALWALAYAYVQTSNSQKWADIESANLDAMVTAMSKSDKLKKSSTVADDLLAANWWRSIWKYTIDSSKVSYVIWETYDEIFDNKQMLDISADVADVDDWQLRTILIAKPAAQVNWNDINTVQLNSDKSLTIWNNTISREDLNDVADELKWYNIWAIWYTTFDTEQEAKDFRDTYFSTYEVYQIWTTWKYAILKEYNQWWESTSIDWKIDTQTREDLLALNNWTWNNQQNNEPQQTEEEILAAQVATIKSNLFDEVTNLQAYLASQWLNSTNNTTVDNMINQVITKINWINWTNKDEKNTEIQNDITTIQALIDSLKAEEVAAAANIVTLFESENWTITHNKNQWTITLHRNNPSTDLIIADKNLWATKYYWEEWALPNEYYWNYYQWWNNYWFPNTWWFTTNWTQVDASSYWPWNYYSSSTFILWWYWDTSSNFDLWWWVTWTNNARRWPCPSWYHVPSVNDASNLILLWNIINWHSATSAGKRWEWTWELFKNQLLLPYAWWMWDRFNSWEISWQWSSWNYYLSERWWTRYSQWLMFDDWYVSQWWNYWDNRWFPIRCFKN